MSLCKNPTLELIKKNSQEYKLLKRQLLRTSKKCNHSKFKTVCRAAISREYMLESFRDSHYALVYYSKKKCKDEYFVCSVLMFSYKEKELYINLLCTRRNKGDASGRILLEVVEKLARKKRIHTIATRATFPAYPFWMKMGFLRMKDACIWDENMKTERLLYPPCFADCKGGPCQYADKSGCKTSDPDGTECIQKNPDANVLCKGRYIKNDIDDGDPVLYGLWLSKCIL
tara:strand:- start:229 stop:915 length:687 start_codon:yes stop_codon:yes gene_type:complete